ncbi:MAG: dihydrodipicolinate synthase family protein, partial [Rhodospirillales bacterium]|nr:dihydrodipicolinate synthase family protein [Rhodospirillales bacterium]
EDESRQVVEVSVEHTGGRVPVIAGTGAMTTTAAVRLSKHAESVGADGVIVVPITYWPLTPDEVYAHYAAISEAISIPICVYNNPWTTGTDIMPETLAKLTEDFDNVRYCKESSADLTRVTEIRKLTGDVMTVFCGWDSMALEHFSAGADGWFGGMGALSPAQCVKLFDLAVDKKDVVAARQYFDQFYPLLRFLCDKSHVRVAHTGLDILGLDMGPPRKPLRMLEGEDHAQLEKILRDFGMLEGAAEAAE